MPSTLFTETEIHGENLDGEAAESDQALLGWEGGNASEASPEPSPLLDESSSLHKYLLNESWMLAWICGVSSKIVPSYWFFIVLSCFHFFLSLSTAELNVNGG